MPAARARAATACPMRPNPTRSNTLPARSPPSGTFHSPPATARMASGMRRLSMVIRAMARSATASLSTGVIGDRYLPLLGRLEVDVVEPHAHGADHPEPGSRGDDVRGPRARWSSPGRPRRRPGPPGRPLRRSRRGQDGEVVVRQLIQQRLGQRQGHHHLGTRPLSPSQVGATWPPARRSGGPGPGPGRRRHPTVRRRTPPRPVGSPGPGA